MQDAKFQPGLLKNSTLIFKFITAENLNSEAHLTCKTRNNKPTTNRTSIGCVVSTCLV